MKCQVGLTEENLCKYLYIFIQMTNLMQTTPPTSGKERENEEGETIFFLTNKKYVCNCTRDVYKPHRKQKKLKDEGKIISIFIFKKNTHTHERTTEKCVIYFFSGGAHSTVGSTCLRESARSGEKMCERVREREKERVCVVLCKYLPRAQEGKEKKARTKTNQHYPVRALFFSEEKE